MGPPGCPAVFVFAAVIVDAGKRGSWLDGKNQLIILSAGHESCIRKHDTNRIIADCFSSAL
jgi:hypothetical protein